MTRSLSPIAVSLSVRAMTPSIVPAFTTIGRSLSLAIFPKASTLASVAAHKSGLLKPQVATAACMTSASSVMSTRLNSEVSAMSFAKAAKAALSPLTSLSATSSGRRFRPTRSYWIAFHTLSLASTAAGAVSEVMRPANTVGLKKVFSWR